MTIETKTAKSYTEAMELVKEFHARRPDCYFVYDTENYGESRKNNTIYRHFEGMGKDGYGICFGMIEIIKDGKLETVRVINTCRDTAIDIKIEPETRKNVAKANEMPTTAKFEEGKTYFRIWNEEDGRPHMSYYTIEKRTAKTIVLKSGARCRIVDWSDLNNSEAVKVSYGTYVLAKDVATVEAERRQAERDNWWEQEYQRVAERAAELKAIEVEREEIMSTPFTTADAVDAAAEAETELANAVITETGGSEDDVEETFTANVLPADDDDDDELIDEPETTPEPPTDDFATKLTELEAAKADAQAKEEAAKAVYQAAADETKKRSADLQKFLDEHAARLCNKLQALAPAQRMELITARGTREFCRDFTNLYVDAPNSFGRRFIITYYNGRILAHYDTPAQVETVIELLKTAIERGDKEFTFPTVEELSAPSELEIIRARRHEVCIELCEFRTALEETGADDEMSQSHIDYLKEQIQSLSAEYDKLWDKEFALKTQKGVA